MYMHVHEVYMYMCTYMYNCTYTIVGINSKASQQYNVNGSTFRALNLSDLSHLPSW